MAPDRFYQSNVTDLALVLPYFRRKQPRSERSTVDCHYRGDRDQGRDRRLGTNSR